MLQFIQKKAGKTYRSLKVRWAYLTGKAYPYKPYAIKQPVTMRENRPKVLHFIGNFFTGGSSRLVIDLLEYMGGEYEQEIITQRLASPPAYTGATATEYSTAQQQEMLEYIARYQPDFVHVHYWAAGDLPWYTAVFEVLEKAGTKVIENINVPVAPYRSSAVHTYVYVSNYVLNTFGSAEDHNVVIYPGSDFDLFSNNKPNVADYTIGMVYRLDTDKLNEKSIDVFIEVALRCPKVRCLIVGGGSLLKLYREKVIQKGVLQNFEFTGYVSYNKLPALYRRMGIFVAPVWQESFGQVSPFAMSMGIPVVGYNIGALEEIIGDPSLLAVPGNSKQLAEIIVQLLENPSRRKAIGVYNQQRAQNNFSVQQMINSYRNVYSQIAPSEKITTRS